MTPRVETVTRPPDAAAAPRDADRLSAVLAASIVYSVAMMLPNATPALIGLLAEHRGLGGTELGLVGGAYPLGLSIVAFSSYLWVRRVDVRASIGLGMSTLTAAVALMAYATSFRQFLLLMLAAGLGGGAAAAPSLTALGDGTNPQKNLGVMIFTSVVLPAAAIAAVPPATLALGFSGPFLLLAALCLASLACLAWHPRLRRAQPSSVADASGPPAAGMKTMVTALAAMALFAAGYVAAWFFLERIGNQSGLDHVSVLDSLATGSLIGGFGGFVAVALGRWMSLRGSFLLAIAATACALLSLEILRVTLTLYFVVVVGFQLWINVNFSNIMTFIAIKDAAGRSVAMIPGLQSAGAMAGSIAAGLAFEGWGRAGVVAASIVPLMACAALMVPVLSRPTR